MNYIYTSMVDGDDSLLTQTSTMKRIHIAISSGLFSTKQIKGKEVRLGAASFSVFENNLYDLPSLPTRPYLL